MGQMRPQALGSVRLPPLGQTIENGEVILALQPVALAIEHGAIGQQAPDSVDPPDRVQEKR